jgi:hypothetical protein
VPVINAPPKPAAVPKAAEDHDEMLAVLAEAIAAKNIEVIDRILGITHEEPT